MITKKNKIGNVNEYKLKNDVRVHRTFSSPDKWVLTSKLFGFYHEPLIELNAEKEDIARKVYFKLLNRLGEINETLRDVSNEINAQF